MQVFILKGKNMFAQLKKSLMIFVICSMLAFSAPISVSAQDEIVSDQFTFLQVGQNDISLTGPHESRTFSFGLPADWKLDGGGELELLMTISFNQPVATDPNVPAVVSGGILTVEFNDVAIGVIPLSQAGQVQERLSIPVEAMQSTRADGRMKLDLILDSGISCYLNQQMAVIIHAGSNFTFPHAVMTPDTPLANFPRPLYQASIVQDSVLFVVPDNPSSAELRSVLTVAAGLGNLTSSSILMDLATVSELTPTKVADHDLILVGKANSMPLLSDLKLPASVVSGKFKDSNQDDGVIQMVNSPWNPANVVLLVGGNTDAGIVKAAQAISTGVIRSGTVSNLSIVESVQPNPINPTLAVYQTLADLGYGDNQLIRYGSNTATYRFYIPPGATISADAYFELAYTHSALVDYDRSGVVVSLNNRPIGSARFTDASAANSANRLRVSIPPSTIIPGNNLLAVNVNLLPLDICSDPSFQDLWAMIWSDSYLNLPLGIFPAEVASVLGLDTYPAPFSFDSTLGGSAFLLQRDNPEAWRAALQIAGFLGDRTGGVLTTLGAFYADEIPESEKANYNMLVVGQPSKLPIMAELNQTLPAPFIDGGDIASQENMQVTFRVPSGSPVGYLQMSSSPWNPDKVVLTIAGNSSAGIRWANSALLEPVLRAELAGNFAVIDGTQILTGDTRMLAPSQISGAIPTASVSQAGAPSEPIDITPPTVVRPAWILPTLIISIVSVLVVLVWMAVGQRRNHRPKAKPREN
jgi:hypothetical protein